LNGLSCTPVVIMPSNCLKKVDYILPEEKAVEVMELWYEYELYSYRSVLTFLLISSEMWNLLYQNSAPAIMMKSVT
jgi:hypothetical protein